jgi:hypothetical protein
MWSNGYDDYGMENNTHIAISTNFEFSSSSGPTNSFPNGGTERISWATEVSLAHRALTYDATGGVASAEVVVRPLATAEAEVDWNGAWPMVSPGVVEAGGSCYGRVRALTGAPEGVTIPVKVWIQGEVSSVSSVSVTPPQFNGNYAEAYSSFSCAGADIATNVVVSGTGVDGYDMTLTVNITTNDSFFCICGVKVYPAITCSDGSRAEYEHVQATADPFIEIDPAFLYKDLYALEFSRNITNPPSPLSVSLRGVTNGTAALQVTCPVSNVCAIEAIANLKSTNWQMIAEVTNFTETLSFTDTSAGSCPQRFYRVRALRRAD